MQAFLEQAGFSYPLNLTDTIPAAQFADFQGQLGSAFAVLCKIVDLWNATTPTLVAGFEVRRDEAAARLAAEPVGSFLCRISIASGGNLVLTCKARSLTTYVSGAALRNCGMSTRSNSCPACVILQRVISSKEWRSLPASRLNESAVCRCQSRSPRAVEGVVHVSLSSEQLDRLQGQSACELARGVPYASRWVDMYSDAAVEL